MRDFRKWTEENKARGWDWEDPAFQAQVLPGMVLMTDDCAYMVVRSVESDGVFPDPWPRLWSWGRLKSRGCFVVENPWAESR